MKMQKKELQFQGSKTDMPKRSLSPLMIAAEETPDVKDHCMAGLAALRGNRAKVKASDSRKLRSSIDIDSAVKMKYPNESRWDYAVEYGDEVFFLEVHPGSTSNISEVMKKLSWLKQWLSTNAPKIEALKATSKSPYYWAYTNNFSVLKSSRQYKAMLQAGLVLVKTMNL